MSKYTVCRQEWRHFPKVLVMRNVETNEERRYVPDSLSIRLKVENSRLLKLCKMFAEYVSQDRCEGCCCKSRCRDGLIDECWMLSDIRELASELGMVVD